MPSQALAPRVLVVDDEPQIVRALKVVLREAGFEAVSAETGAEALDRAAVRPPQAAIVDLVLPDMRRHRADAHACASGARCRSSCSRRSARRSRRCSALEAGADDYITKPFGSRELVARLQRRAAARRRAPRRSRRSWSDGLEIDLAARAVRREGEPVHLTPIEFDLLRVLARNRGRLMTHRALLAEVWGPEYVDDVQTLRTHIARLRAKIEPEGGGAALHRHRPGRRLPLFRIAGFRARRAASSQNRYAPSAGIVTRA